MAELRICLDPGHTEGYKKGIVPGYYEGTENFYLAQYLKSELERYEDIKVFLTRTEMDQDPSLQERGETAVKNNCQVFISLHTNGFSKESAHGVSCFYSLHRAESKHLVVRLGEAVANLMKEGTGITYFRGAAIRKYPDHPNWDYYGVIRNSVGKNGQNEVVQYSYIIEHGFHSNLKECEWLFKHENLKKIAVLEAQILADYFGKKLIPAPNPGHVFTIGERVKVKESATTWASGKNMPSWIKTKIMYVRSDEYLYNGERTVKISTKSEGSVTGAARCSDLILVTEEDQNNVKFTNGMKVKFKEGSKTWSSGKSIPSWVLSKGLFTVSDPYQYEGKETIKVSTTSNGSATGAAFTSDLEVR